MSRTVRLIYANAGPGHTPLGFWTGRSFSGNPAHGRHIPRPEGRDPQGHGIQERREFELAETKAREAGVIVCGGNLAGVWIVEMTL